MGGQGWSGGGRACHWGGDVVMSHRYGEGGGGWEGGRRAGGGGLTEHVPYLAEAHAVAGADVDRHERAGGYTSEKN